MSEITPSLMPYWYQNDFHELLKKVPFKQVIQGEQTVVNVSHMFFKMDGQTLVSAIVPPDLSIPTQWEVVADLESPLAAKAASMLGDAMRQLQ